MKKNILLLSFLFTILTFNFTLATVPITEQINYTKISINKQKANDYFLFQELKHSLFKPNAIENQPFETMSIVGISLYAAGVVVFFLGFIIPFISILSVLFWLVGSIISLISLIKINKSQGKYRGKGLAIAGIILSPLSLLLLTILVVLAIALLSE